ncbi:putative TetR family transcriptional regulator [Gordonia araii NBRC 100433]|uniref:Putative TetR family transcriptional regulator n=1 Tax=Gordonia araii NBRC 100433 TaxID=1073574 RepID=G7H2G7_9ACTN|nr:TetR/AcrR family transcriptional regulator [Gordonia araii]NNG97580.1 TetR/AcrR family transcriptional regulator [Gordonia araii NBRC 100433]GAB10042.1 putative TetR family transcriptional regulator [Gordonia araii NBRC 100433]
MAYVRAQDREAQVVAAAIRVLSRVGVPAATVRAVAAEADMPLGTLHYVFPSKDQLMRAVLAAVIDDISDALRSDLELDKGVAHALRHGIGAFWEKLVAHDIGLQVMQYELTMYSLRGEVDGGLARFQYERYNSLVTQFCEQAAQASGERCAVGFDSLGRLALSVVDGLILQYIAKPDPERARRDLDNALDMLVVYADPQPVTRGGKRRTA